MTKIFIVDRDSDTVSFLQDSLALLGFKTMACAEPTAVTAEVALFEPNWVIVDVMSFGERALSMPDEMRAAVADICLIALGGRYMLPSRRDVLAAGYNFHLEKPASLCDIIRAVSAGCNSENAGS